MDSHYYRKYGVTKCNKTSGNCKQRGSGRITQQFTAGQILRNIKYRLVVNKSFVKHLKTPGPFLIAKFYENNVSVYHPLVIDDSKSPIIGRNLMEYNFSLRKGYFFGDKIDAQVLQNIQEEAREHELILLWGTETVFASVLKKMQKKKT